MLDLADIIKQNPFIIGVSLGVILVILLHIVMYVMYGKTPTFSFLNFCVLILMVIYKDQLMITTGILISEGCSTGFGKQKSTITDPKAELKKIKDRYNINE